MPLRNERFVLLIKAATLVSLNSLPDRTAYDRLYFWAYSHDNAPPV